MTKLTPPPRSALIRETRVLLEAARMIVPLTAAQLRRTTETDDRLVIVLPGFGADDRHTAPLRHFLRKRGFVVEGWSMGRNRAGQDLPNSVEQLSDRWPVEARADYNGEAAVPCLVDRFIEHAQSRHRQTGREIVLIGWSLGGYIAREVARDLPDVVEQVITLGSPVVGGPKYTATGRYFARQGADLDWIEAMIERREDNPIRQPVTMIYSKSDGIVAWPAAIDRFNRNVEHIEINGSHIGMAFNPSVWTHIVGTLKRSDEGAGTA